jgi:hypothetical protein
MEARFISSENSRKLTGYRFNNHRNTRFAPLRGYGTHQIWSNASTVQPQAGVPPPARCGAIGAAIARSFLFFELFNPSAFQQPLKGAMRARAQNDPPRWLVPRLMME